MVDILYCSPVGCERAYAMSTETIFHIFVVNEALDQVLPPRNKSLSLEDTFSSL